MEDIEEYLKSCHGIMKAPLVYIVSKTIMVQTYGDCPKYVTPVNEMIARMLYLPPDNNKLLRGHEASSVKKHTAEYKIDIKTIYKIHDQIFKGPDLYPHVKQHKSKRDKSRNILCHPL